MAKYNLVVKLHPLSKTVINDNRIIFDNSFSTLDMAVVSDYVITDYSAIAIEAAVLDVKLLYYVYDYEKYKSDNGLNIDLFEDMPGTFVGTV